MVSVKGMRRVAKEKVLEMIRGWYNRARVFSTFYLWIRHKNLYHSACFHFGSCENAIDEAGLDSKIAREKKQAIADEVIARIKDLVNKNESLYAYYVSKNYPVLYDKGCFVFGSWDLALSAAGLDARQIRLRESEKWNKKKIIRLIIRLHEQKEEINLCHVARFHPKLLSAAQRHFGSYENAIKAAGLDYRTISKQLKRKWSKEAVLADIRLFVKVGMTLNEQVVRITHPTLRYAGRRFFQSWRNAVKAAGYEYENYLEKKWNTNKWLNNSPLIVNELDERIANLPAAKTKSKIAEKSRSTEDQRTPGQKRVIKEILELWHADEPLNFEYVKTRHSSLCFRAQSLFKSWARAIIASGLEYDRIKKNKKMQNFTDNKSPAGEYTPAQQRVIDEINNLFKSNIELNFTNIKNNYPSLYSRSRYHFKSWDKAILAAGLNYKMIRDGWSQKLWLDQLTEETINALEKQIISIHTGEENKMVKIEEPQKKTQRMEIPIELLEMCPDQPRKFFDEQKLLELAASIKEKQILQEIIVRPWDGKYQVVFGARRVRAARLVGLKKMPALIINADDQEALELALVENIQRQDLTPFEEGLAVVKMIKQYGYDVGKIIECLGKSEDWIRERLKLISLPEQVQKYVVEGDLNLGQATLLVKLDDPSEQIALAKEIAQGSLNKEQTREAILKALAESKQTAKNTEGKDVNIPLIKKLIHFLKKLDCETLAHPDLITLINVLSDLKSAIDVKLDRLKSLENLD